MLQPRDLLTQVERLGSPSRRRATENRFEFHAAAVEPLAQRAPDLL
jgi:hypothetical protein